jgi:hypothetical protein
MQVTRAGVCAATLVACSTPPDLGPFSDPGAVAQQGQYVTLYYHPPAVPCAGSLPYLDANAKAIADYLGVSLKTQIPYHYNNALPCVSEAYGCTATATGEPPTVWANAPNIVHELVHAVQFQNGPVDVSFVNESVAVALGDIEYNGVPAGVSDDTLLSADPLPGDDYPIAGDFGSYLLTRFGAAPFEALAAAAVKGSTPDEVEADFASAYGETMTALRADRQASSASFLRDRIGLSECYAIAPDPNVADGGTVNETLGCDTNGVGVEQDTMFRFVPFDVPADGLYKVALSVPDGGYAELTGCGMLTEVDWGLAEPAGAGTALVLGYFPAGRYSLWITAPATSTVAFPFAVTPVVLGTAATCASVPTVEVPPGTTAIVVFSMLPAPLEFPLRVGTNVAAVEWAGLQSTAQVCLGGCDVDCVEATTSLAVVDGGVDVTSPVLEAGVTYALKAQLNGPQGYIVVDLEGN